LQPFQNLPAASQVDPRRLFPRPSARDCPTKWRPHEYAAPPEPIDERRAATQPTDNPRCAPPTSPPAATHRHRAPDATRLFVPPSCRTNATRRMPHEPMPPEPIDGRRTATQPTDDPACARAATHRHRAPDATRLLFLRAAARLPHECLMSQCRPSQSTGDAPRWSPPAIWRTRRPPHRPPPRTVTAPPTRPPRPPTPRRDHARSLPSTRRRAACSGRAAAPC